MRARARGPGVNGAPSAPVPLRPGARLARSPRSRASVLSAVSVLDLSPDGDLPPLRRGPFRPERLAPVRERLSGAVLRRVLRSVDALVATAGALAGAGLAGNAALAFQAAGAVAPLMAGLLVTLAALDGFGAYAFAAREPLWLQLTRAWAGAAAGMLAALALAWLVPAGRLSEAVAAGLCTASALSLSHTWAWLRVRRWRKAGRLTPNIVVVGATENAARLIESALATREVNVIGLFDDRADRVGPTLHGVPVLGDTSALLEHRLLPYVDRVVITVTSTAQARIGVLIQRLRVLPNTVTLFVDVAGEQERAEALARLTASPLAHVSGVRQDERRALAKRGQDLVIASTALVLISPLLALIALAVKLDSPGPVLFRQRRHGFNNESITVWKFRSMRTDAADATAARQVQVDDDRVTRVGRFIRRTSLDELPQLWNVLRGEMSLVGPRPHAIGMKTGDVESARLVAEYAWRHRMKPGITGWAQINGSRGAVDTAESVRRRVSLDIAYIERQSFWFDLYILVMTLPRLLGDGEAVR